MTNEQGLWVFADWVSDDDEITEVDLPLVAFDDVEERFEGVPLGQVVEDPYQTAPIAEETVRELRTLCSMLSKRA